MSHRRIIATVATAIALPLFALVAPAPAQADADCHRVGKIITTEHKVVDQFGTKQHYFREVTIRVLRCDDGSYVMRRSALPWYGGK